MSDVYEKIKDTLLKDGFTITKDILDTDDKLIGYNFYCNRIWDKVDKYGEYQTTYSIDFNIFENPLSGIIFQLVSGSLRHGNRITVQYCKSYYELNLLLNKSYIEPIYFISVILQKLMDQMGLNVKFWEGNYRKETA